MKEASRGGKVQLKLPVDTARGKPAPCQALVSQQEKSAWAEPRGKPRGGPEQGNKGSPLKEQGCDLKVNRKRINAAVWHDSPRVGSRGLGMRSSICRPPATRPLVSATFLPVTPGKGPVWLSLRPRRP